MKSICVYGNTFHFFQQGVVFGGRFCCILFYRLHWGILSVILFTICASLLGPFLGAVNIALLFLLPVLFTAVKWGRRISVVISILAVLSFDFFLIPPYGSLTVWDMRYLVSFFMFLTVAWLTGTMSQRLEDQVQAINERESRMAALNTLSQKIAFTTDLDSVLQTILTKTKSPKPFILKRLRAILSHFTAKVRL